MRYRFAIFLLLLRPLKKKGIKSKWRGGAETETTVGRPEERRRACSPWLPDHIDES